MFFNKKVHFEQMQRRETIKIQKKKDLPFFQKTGIAFEIFFSF